MGRTGVTESGGKIGEACVEVASEGSWCEDRTERRRRGGVSPIDWSRDEEAAAPGCSESLDSSRALIEGNEGVDEDERLARDCESQNGTRMTRRERERSWRNERNTRATSE